MSNKNKNLATWHKDRMENKNSKMTWKHYVFSNNINKTNKQ